MFGFINFLEISVEAVDEVIFYVLCEILDIPLWTAAGWSEFLAPIIVYICAFFVGLRVSRWAFAKYTFVASLLSPPRPPTKGRERRASTDTAPHPPVAFPPPPSPSPFKPEDFFLFNDMPREKFWWVDKRPYAQRLKEDNAIMYRSLSRELARQGYKFESRGRSVTYEELWTGSHRSQSGSQQENTRISAESDVHESPGVTEASAPSEANDPQQYLVESLQCPDAAPAADAGRAHVPTSTEEMTKQEVEPLQDVCAENTRANPVPAPVPVSTDEMAKPAVSAPTWLPSSGPQYHLRGPDPIFNKRVPTWLPSSGPQYHLRGPDPRFNTPIPAWKPSSGPENSRREHDIRSMKEDASFTNSTKQNVPTASTPEPASISPKPAVAIMTSAQGPAPRSPSSASRQHVPPRRNFPGSKTHRTAAPISAPTPAPVRAAPTHVPILSTASSKPLAFTKGVYDISEQDWMRPISEMLALDIGHWGMSEEKLMAWKVAPKALVVNQFQDKTAEDEARENPLTLASRYGGIAVELKKCLVLLRLQLAHSRHFFRPDFENFYAVRRMILTATASFTRLSNSNLDNEDFPGADFSLFRNALAFFVDHIADDPKFEVWVRENRLMYGAEIIDETKRKAKYVHAIAGGKHAREAHQVAEA